MMTLRIGPRRGKNPHGPKDGFPVLAPPRSEDLLTLTTACPYCQRHLIGYRFTTGDGLPITTYHCAQHGDVIPLHGPSCRINDE